MRCNNKHNVRCGATSKIAQIAVEPETKVMATITYSFGATC